MTKRKDAFLPQLRVPQEFADRCQRAIEKSGHDMPNLRRRVWLVFCEAVESGQQPSWPPKFLTEKEYVHLSDAFEFNGIANHTDFYAACGVALIQEALLGRKIQWPPRFELRKDAPK